MRLHIFPKCLPPRQAFFTKNCKSEIKKRRGIPRLSFLFQVLLSEHIRHVHAAADAAMLAAVSVDAHQSYNTATPSDLASLRM